MDSLRSLRDREEGQGLVEYALILALISVVLAAVLTEVSTAIETVFNSVVTKLGEV
ncbi:MAG TPA: Flp family type IVb pilin [Solirubrobacterales bacterium]|nr:Flp family type IVb pilin [Solirubrobacterales bacterium]